MSEQERDDLKEFNVSAGETAEIIGVDVDTLARWRRERKHLRFMRVGERLVRYNRADLLAFKAASVVSPISLTASPTLELAHA